MKRVMAICGGGFRKNLNKNTIMILLITEGIMLRKLLIKYIEVDGFDATDKILEVMRKESIELIISGSIPIAGFNLINAKRIFDEKGIPSIFILEKEPDMEAVKRALMKHFEDWRRRLAILEEVKIQRVQTLKGEIILGTFGIDLEESIRIIESITIFGKTPEPLRLARMLAKSITKFIKT
ncbi:MAG: DUF99 family protein [Candidatus Methanomethyliaceae archaeon]|nr:DUF99 family protein [Candidatus Methanomethyliaceae archaeon]MDW7970481.1 DUF99 family protein [Nitrososphaerota archaeon]